MYLVSVCPLGVSVRTATLSAWIGEDSRVGTSSRSLSELELLSDSQSIPSLQQWASQHFVQCLPQQMVHPAGLGTSSHDWHLSTRQHSARQQSVHLDPEHWLHQKVFMHGIHGAKHEEHFLSLHHFRQHASHRRSRQISHLGWCCITPWRKLSRTSLGHRSPWHSRHLASHRSIRPDLPAPNSRS